MKKITIITLIAFMISSMAFAQMQSLNLSALSESGKSAYGFVHKESDSPTPPMISSFDIGNPTEVVPLYDIQSMISAAAYANDTYYVYLYQFFMGYNVPYGFASINLKTGEVTDLGDYTGMGINLYKDMSFDYSTKTMYAIGVTETYKTMLLTVNLKDGNFTKIAELKTDILTLACNYDGELFGISTVGDLCEINKRNGDITVIGSTGEIPALVYQSMDFDHTNNTLYWAGYNSASQGFLANVNTSTATLNKIGTIGNNAQIAGLYIPYRLAVDGAPASVSDFTVNPAPQGALSATLTWKNPDKNYAGFPLSSLTAVKVFKDGTLVHTISSPRKGGTETWKDTDFTKSMLTNYKVVPVNVVGDGFRESKTVFVGKDLPSIKTASFVYSDNKAQISWIVDELGMNDGWVDKSSLKFSVKRLPDDLVIATDITTLETTDSSIEQVNSYSYGITASNADGTGGTAITNSLIVGSSLQLPYYCDLSTQQSFDVCTIIDANNDGITWERFQDSNADTWHVEYKWNDSKQADDWLITPPMKFKAGKSYRLRFDVMCKSFSEEESMQVYIGKGATVAAQSTKLDEFKITNIDIYVTKFIEIKGLEDADYNVGFKATSAPNKYGINMSNVAIEEILNKDLVALKITGTALPSEGKEFLYKVMVYNNGMEIQNNYTIHLTDADGNILKSTHSTVAIQPNSSEAITVNWTPSISGKIKLFARVELAGDENTSNDISKYLAIDIQPIGSVDWVEIGRRQALSQNQPFDLYMGPTSVAQNIYFSSDMNVGSIPVTGGVIEKIIYICKNSSAKNINNLPVKIYMANTTLRSLNDGWIPESQLSLVFDGTITMPMWDSFIEITLDTPFIYTGDNLCVMSEKPTMMTEVANFLYFYTSIDNVNKSRSRVYVDYPAFDFSQNGKLGDDVPDIKIAIQTTAGGSISGKVSEGTMAIADATIIIEKYNTKAFTDASGNFSFEFVPKSTDFSVRASKVGYADLVKSNIVITEAQNSVVDFNLTQLKSFVVKGNVISVDNKPISGVKVNLSGYVNLSTTTDIDGNFAFNDVYVANGYILKLSKRGFVSNPQKINVIDADVTIDNIKLFDDILVPGIIRAAEIGNNSEISWVSPYDVMGFRYDDNMPVTSLGSDDGTSKTVLGSVHRQPTSLINMSWMTSDYKGPRATVNIFVLDLDDKGLPTSTVLFSQMNVPNVDTKWQTFYFPTPVEAPRGFFIGISYEGYVAISMDSGTDPNYPFMKDTHYFAGDYTTGEFYTMESQGNISFSNFMIRAEGVEMGPTRDLKSYSVWRIAADEDESTWRLLTAEPITETFFTDNEWSKLDIGNYQYAIRAHYSNNRTSDVGLSNVINKNIAPAVEEHSSDDALIKVYPNPVKDFINIEGKYNSLEIYNAAGKLVITANGESKINVNALSNGVYIIKARYNGKVGISRIVK